MYNYVSELINTKDVNFKNLALIPGLNSGKPFLKSNESINIENVIMKDKDVINEKIFVKFFGSINETKNKSSRKKRHKFFRIKNTKKNNKSK
jgi:hypothetical protein